MEDFESATDKILMGPERRQNALTDEDKKLIAYHEAGHAIVGLNCKYHDPLHKVTIIPRGRAMGVTMSLSEKDRFGYTKQELLDRLASMYGGREAEAAIFGDDHVTTGAGNDIQQATNIAKAMVKEYGMGSNATGRVRYSSDQQEVFLGHSVSQSTNISAKYAELVDDEVKAITSAAEERARQILETKREDLHKVAEALLVYETLTGDEVRDLLAGKDISKPDVMPDDEAEEIREEVRKDVRKSSVPNSPLPRT
jgi:cell division protease FtsH